MQSEAERAASAWGKHVQTRPRVHTMTCFEKMGQEPRTTCFTGMEGVRLDKETQKYVKEIDG